jgi:hypothetical protein
MAASSAKTPPMAAPVDFPFESAGALAPSCDTPDPEGKGVKEAVRVVITTGEEEVGTAWPKAILLELATLMMVELAAPREATSVIAGVSSLSMVSACQHKTGRQAITRPWRLTGHSSGGTV